MLDEISDPGNAGTLIRSAESFGVTGVISVGGVDLYNPKVVRASAGSLFRVPCTQMESSEVVLQALSESGYSCWATTPQEGVSPESLATETPVAVVLGSEPHGLDPTTVKDPSYLGLTKEQKEWIKYEIAREKAAAKEAANEATGAKVTVKVRAPSKDRAAAKISRTRMTIR